MAQFRTTADLVDAVLTRAGETTSGTSPYEADALTYLNKIHQGIISGGLIFNVAVDEDWMWARAKHPYVIELQPAITTGTLTFTASADSVTFSSAPSVSVKDWFVRIDGESTLYRIAAHTAGATAAEIDGFYTGTTGAKTYTCFKLDYELVPSHIYIETGINDKLDFIRTGSTEATATLTAGAYTPSALATHAQTQITSAAGGTSTYGVTYDSVTRKFTFTSDTAGSDVFKRKGATGTNVARSAWGTFGMDYVDDTTSSDSYTSTYILGGVSRLVAPIRNYTTGRANRDISIIDPHTMQSESPLWGAGESVPEKAAVIYETAEGALTLRFNSYPAEKVKLEINVVEIPLDLKDVAASLTRVPRKFADILEYGAAYHIAFDKKSDDAQAFSELARAQLQLMQTQHRTSLKRTDPGFGLVVARPDLIGGSVRLRFGYDAESQ